MKAYKMNLSLGLIEQIKRNEDDEVRYLIRYRTENGKEHTTWSNWMRDDNYKVGDSIAIRTQRVPGTFGLVNVAKDIDRHPQTTNGPLVTALIIASVCAAVAGFVLGKTSKK